MKKYLSLLLIPAAFLLSAGSFSGGSFSSGGFMPAAQTIAAGNVITADACGMLKQITSAGAVTTDTTNTFTAPSAANTGCIMTLVNVGSQNITLDNNALFKSAGGADVVMTGNDSVVVASNGTLWYQISALLAN